MWMTPVVRDDAQTVIQHVFDGTMTSSTFGRNTSTTKTVKGGHNQNRDRSLCLHCREGDRFPRGSLETRGNPGGAWGPWGAARGTCKTDKKRGDAGQSISVASVGPSRGWGRTEVSRGSLLARTIPYVCIKKCLKLFASI